MNKEHPAATRYVVVKGKIANRRLKGADDCQCGLGDYCCEGDNRDEAIEKLWLSHGSARCPGCWKGTYRDEAIERLINQGQNVVSIDVDAELLDGARVLHLTMHCCFP